MTAAFALPACASSHAPEDDADAAPPGCMPPVDCDVGPTNPPEPRGECPAERPTEGTLCNVAEDELCGYDDCGGYWTFEATCRQGQWRVEEWSCNPPPPWEECPEVAPERGAPCEALTFECSYEGCAGADSVIATCGSEGWEVSETICNPPAPEDGGIE